jgi:NAD(P)-dependent dehydrogenase (short-subunit alcohol dehydrogenase family)
MGLTQDFSLAGRVALVTGAARGIGLACARVLAEAGAAVMLTDLDGAAAATAVADLVSEGHRAIARAHDVTDEADWAATVEATLRELGGLDVLVNNAGVYQGGTLVTNTLEGVRRVHRVNVESVFLGMRAAALVMMPGGAAGHGGSIVNLSSVAGLIGVPGHTAYGSTKGAVRLYSRHAAAEFGALGYGIRVNSVHPGLIATAMGAEVFRDFVDIGLAEDEGAAREIVLGMTAMGRLGTPREVANTVLFLACDASAYVTGAEFVVDGGMSAR